MIKNYIWATTCLFARALVSIVVIIVGVPLSLLLGVCAAVAALGVGVATGLYVVLCASRILSDAEMFKGMFQWIDRFVRKSSEKTAR